MLVSTFLTWLLVNPIVAAQAIDQPPAAPMITRVYQVADLVVPFAHTPAPAPTAAQPCPAPCVTCPGRGTPNTTEERLISLIRTQVAPASWTENGGAAAMTYYPVGMTLVVRQTPACQKQIANLLQSLRRAQDTQVAIEVRLIAVPEEFTLRKGCPCDGKNTPTGGQYTADLCTPIDLACGAPVFLDSKGLSSFLATTLADRRTNVMMMPKLTAANAQDATIAVTEQHFFVTDVTEKRHNGEVIYLPHNQPFTTGMTMNVQPVVSADGHFVKMKFAVEDTELADAQPPLHAVTTLVTPVYEGGAKGQPVPFTQYVQSPVFEHHRVARTFVVPDGGTAVLTGWKKKAATQAVIPDVLRDLPFVSCLFLNACQAAPANERVLVLVTPRVLGHEERETRPPTPLAHSFPNPGPVVPALYEEATPAPANTQLTKILARYQAACIKGDRAAATQWAVQALAIEPTCFAKKSR